MTTPNPLSIRLQGLSANNRELQSLKRLGQPTRTNVFSTNPMQEETRSILPGSEPLAVNGLNGNELHSLIQKISSRPKNNAEILRICNIPIVSWMDPAECDEVSRQNINADYFRDGMRLFAPQANGLVAFDKYSTLFGPIGVGWGKTLLGLMILGRTLAMGLKRTMLCVPPQVFGQLWKHDIPWSRRRINLSVPFHGLYGLNRAQRQHTAKSGKQGCYIMPYSLLSTPDSVDLIDAIKPELVVLDEAHLIKRRDAARTRRMLDYLEEHKPLVVAMSGTMTSKGIFEYYHMIRHCLGKNTPLPLIVNQALEWSAVIDANASPSEAMAGPLLPLVNWANANFKDCQASGTSSGVRTAYRLRLTTAPGVVATSDQEIGTSLLMANVRVPEQVEDSRKKLQYFQEQVEKEWLTPQGDPIDHAIHKYKWLYELTAGFYNELRWPEAENWAKRKQISLKEAEGELELAKMHLALHNVYVRKLRDFLKDGGLPGMDTPMLVGLEIQKNGTKNIPEELVSAWVAMKKYEWEGMPDREPHAIRVCDYKIQHLLQWARDTQGRGEGGIIWVYHQEIGLWIYEELLKAGLEAQHAPAGENESILDPDNRKKIFVASLGAHSTGKNLQHFHNQIFLQWPRQAPMAEQAIGRTHRNGQTADCLIIWTINTSLFDDQVFAATLNDAVYVQQTTGTRQKILYATYDEPPRIYPYQFLEERGLQVKKLTPEMQRMLKERFQHE